MQVCSAGRSAVWQTAFCPRQSWPCWLFPSRRIIMQRNPILVLGCRILQVERRVGLRPEWEAPLLAAHISLDDWRKTSQWSTLTRAHAQLMADEVRAAQRCCQPLVGFGTDALHTCQELASFL